MGNSAKIVVKWKGAVDLEFTFGKKLVLNNVFMHLKFERTLCLSVCEISLISNKVLSLINMCWSKMVHL